MSTFHTTTATCTACGTEHEVDRVISVNVDRMPEHRVGVLARGFQAITCPSCSEPARIAPSVTYVDLARGQWIRVETATELDQRDAHEAKSRTLFERAYGAEVPAVVQAMGAQLTPRLVFGWPALREKLIIHDQGLDDVTIELLKAAILRAVPGAPIGGPTALRLVDGGESELQFQVVDDATGTATDDLTVPRDLYRDLLGDPAPWAALREDLEASYHVDITRFVR